MCIKLYTVIKLIYKTQHRYLHKHVFKMNTAYLRHTNNSEQFQITFQYTNPELNVNRQFNFSRQLNETVDTFTNRVSVNVEKFINKKTKKKKKEETSEAIQQVNVSVEVNKESIKDDLTCREVFKEQNDVILKVIDQEYQVVINSPWIDNIALSSSILSTFPVYPSKFETVFTDKKLSEFVWYKSADKKNWVEVGVGFIYTPTNADVDCFLKLSCTPKNNSKSGPGIEIVSEVKVDASPGECPFETRHLFTREKTKHNEYLLLL